MKRKIAIDVDDVLFDFVNPFLDFWNEKYKTSFKKEDVFSFNLERVFGVLRKEKNEMMNEFYKSPFFKNLHPIPMSQEILSYLKEENENIIVTSRLVGLEGIDMKEITESSLEKNFKGNYSAVFYSKNHETNGQSKANICEREKASLLVEDCLYYAFECDQKRIPVFLMDTPWNQGDLRGTLITRVKNWEEVLKELNNYF